MIMCSFWGVLLSLSLSATVFSANGLVAHSGFQAVFKRVILKKILFNVQDNYIHESDALYERNFRNDLTEVERSIRRIQYLKLSSDKEFRFEKPLYNVTATTESFGLLTAFKLVTSLMNTVQFGLLTDDAYVNQVFRIGPTTGLLYADTKLKKGVYNFEVTADIIDLQLHATANVTVNVTLPPPKKELKIEAYSILLPDKKHHFSYLNKPAKGVTPVSLPAIFLSILQPHKIKEGTKVDDFLDNPPEILKNVYEEGLQGPYSNLRRKLTRQKLPTSREINDNALNSKRLENILSPQSLVKFIVPHEQFRYQRAIPPRINAASADETTSATHIDNATVTSIKIHEESYLVECVMSSIILFLITFASVILFGSLAYFVYKRIKKCGDYSVDDDIQYVQKTRMDSDSIIKTDMKSPNFLCVSEIHQKRVTDSIEITKAKLQGSHPPSVFTIQKCYEEHQAQEDDNNDVFIVDMTQMSTNSQDDVYNTITLQSYTNNTPAITATLIGAPPPVSILSSSRRSSIVSGKQSFGSEEMGPNGDMRRKSVTFSDIVELYQIKAN